MNKQDHISYKIEQLKKKYQNGGGFALPGLDKLPQYNQNTLGVQVQQNPVINPAVATGIPGYTPTGSQQAQLDNARRDPIQGIDTSGLDALNRDVQIPTAGEQLQQSTQGVNAESLQTAPQDNNTYQVQNPQQPQYFNPYAGVDIPSAAAYFGESLEKGDTLGSVASGLKLGTGLARNIFGAMGRERVNQEVQNQYREDQRDYVTGANRTVYAEDGGVYKNLEIKPFDVYQNGGRKEGVSEERIMTGEYMSGVSPSNQQIQPNSEVETNEYIYSADGGSIKVEGKTHEQGGEEVELQEGDRVISDNLKLTGKYSKQLKEDFDVKVNAKDTFAKAVDKIYRKIGLQKLINEEEKVAKRIIEEEENTEDAKTKNLNLQFLYKQKQKIEQKKQELEPKRQEALTKVFEYQEQSKPVEESSNYMQDGGEVDYTEMNQQLSPFAYTMFEGNETEKALARQQMESFFQPDNPSNVRGYTMDQHLEEMRPLYEDLKNKGKLINRADEDPYESKYHNNLGSYAVTMFEGTPEEKKRATAEMDQFFSQEERNLRTRNVRAESREDYLKRQRGIYDTMKKEGTLDQWKEENYGEMNSNPEFQWKEDWETRYERLMKEKEERYGNKYQNGGEFNTDRLTGESKALGYIPQGQARTEEGLYGNVNREQLIQTMRNNPWFDWQNFDPQNPQDVKRFQEGYNQLVKEGSKIDPDSKFGEQTQSAFIPLLQNKAIGLEPKGIIPTAITAPQSAPLTRSVGDLPQEEEVIEKTQTRQGTPSMIPLLPDQSATPPGGLDPSLKVNRRYDRLTPYEVSPEGVIVENQRQAQTAYSSIANLPDAQRAAAMAQIASNTQGANAQAINQAETQNAQIANQTAARNAQIQAREEDTAAQDALSYEQRTQTAQAITEEQRMQYMDYMRNLNTSNFNDVRRMNTVNQLFENYNIDSMGNIRNQGSYNADLMRILQPAPNTNKK